MRYVNAEQLVAMVFQNFARTVIHLSIIQSLYDRLFHSRMRYITGIMNTDTKMITGEMSRFIIVLCVTEENC
jgi:hypothetical protein